LSTTISPEWASETFGRLVRGDSRNFEHLLTAFGEPVVLQASRTKVRTYFVATDINGNPAIEKLAVVIGDALLDYATPRSRITAALKQQAETGSVSALMALAAEARDLLVKSDKSGEGGELLLFLLMERLLGYPQLLSKLPHKTNRQVHNHGSDGVHAKLHEDGVLDLYWGESKLHASSSSAMSECFESIGPFLRADGEDSRKQDLLLVREHINVEDEELVALLIKYFDDGHPENLKLRWNGVCLVGFDLSKYPNPAAAAEAELAEIAQRLESWQATMLKHVSGNDLLGVNIDVFCVPFPSVDVLRKAINARIGL
jgi:hypothetical protein